MALLLFGQAILFSVLEKATKEQYVLSLTNSLSFRKMVRINENSGLACAVINQCGTIVYNN